jgi:integrase/recombinase XerD
MAGRYAMNSLRKAVNGYLEIRRCFGFKLKRAGVLLPQFVDFLRRHGSSVITTQLALQWAQSNRKSQPAEWAQRLTVVRCFARYWSAIDSRTEIPPWGLMPYRPKRARPYLYSDDEIRRLLDAAHKLGDLRGLTYYCLFGLLAVTGMRISELINLRYADVDLTAGVLTVRGTKFGKSRLIPIHPSTQKICSRYVRYRDQTFAQAPFFFTSKRGNHLDLGQVRRTFYALSRQIGLRGPTASHGPRLHDFRHRVAVQTLVQWYRTGQDVERQLPVLSTYLGHAHVSDTYWYLTACPELMGVAVKRLERHWEGQS